MNDIRKSIEDLPAEHPVRQRFDAMIEGATQRFGHAPSDATVDMLAENVAHAVTFAIAIQTHDLALAASTFASFVQSVADYGERAEAGLTVGTAPAPADLRPITRDEIIDTHEALSGDVRITWAV